MRRVSRLKRNERRILEAGLSDSSCTQGCPRCANPRGVGRSWSRRAQGGESHRVRCVGFLPHPQRRSRALHAGSADEDVGRFGRQRQCRPSRSTSLGRLRLPRRVPAEAVATSRHGPVVNRSSVASPSTTPGTGPSRVPWSASASAGAISRRRASWPRRPPRGWPRRRGCSIWR